MVTGTTVVVVYYRGFWFGTGTSDCSLPKHCPACVVCYRNFAEILHTAASLQEHRPIHKAMVKTRYDMPTCTPNIAALRRVVWYTLTGTVGDQ